MAVHTPKETAKIAVKSGVKKSNLPLSDMLILGFLAGAFIAFGFLLDIRVSGNLSDEIWGSMGTFIGAAVFPIGLVFVLLAGGELLTGNMMTVSIARFAGRITTGQLIKNWIIITIANFLGAIFVAYFFGHVLGLTETGPFLETTVSIAEAKLNDSFLQAFVSGIGANWMVCLAVWLCLATDEMTGKIIGIWFPVMGFVAIGFQHVVANMFVIPAAIFAGYFSWGEYFMNFVAVFFGNAVGGSLFVGGLYYLAYLKDDKDHNKQQKSIRQPSTAVVEKIR